MYEPPSSCVALEKEKSAAGNKQLHPPFHPSLPVTNFSGSHYLREDVQIYYCFLRSASAAVLTQQYKPIKTTPRAAN